MPWPAALSAGVGAGGDDGLDSGALLVSRSMPLARTEWLSPDPAKLEPVRCDTYERAVTLVRWLGSDEARYASPDQRARTAMAVWDWMADRETYIRHVEAGAQSLLLQAAERVGAL